MENTIKINPAGTEETIEVRLKDYPIAYQKKVEELMEDCGVSREEAEKMADCTIVLELYYHKSCGLFALETEAVESCSMGGLYSPYDGETELMEDEELDD